MLKDDNFEIRGYCDDELDVRAEIELGNINGEEWRHIDRWWKYGKWRTMQHMKGCKNVATNNFIKEYLYITVLFG